MRSSCSGSPTSLTFSLFLIALLFNCFKCRSINRVYIYIDYVFSENIFCEKYGNFYFKSDNLFWHVNYMLLIELIMFFFAFAILSMIFSLKASVFLTSDVLYHFDHQYLTKYNYYNQFHLKLYISIKSRVNYTRIFLSFGIKTRITRETTRRKRDSEKRRHF